MNANARRAYEHWKTCRDCHYLTTALDGIGSTDPKALKILQRLARLRRFHERKTWRTSAT